MSLSDLDMHPALRRALDALVDPDPLDLEMRRGDLVDFWERWTSKWVPPLYARADLGSLKASQQPERTAAWLADGSARNLWLVGPKGTGKTFTAYAVACEAAAAAGATRPVLAVAPVVWSLAALLDDLRPTGGDPEGVWAGVKSTPLLVLDDFAHTRPTDWAVERMWMLADHRTTHQLRTVVTTNATSTDLTAAWGEATIDRLMDAAAVVKIAGESLRRPAW